MKKLLAVLMLAFAVTFSGAGFAQTPAKPDIIEVIDISGEINTSLAAFVATQVEKINETPKVKGVLLVINSPGGGASASAVLYQELSKIKVPVVGYCEYMCASGGVYALMAPSVKFIAVRDDSIGGSVGVILQMTRFNRLLDWAKIDNETFKSGSLKDAGNPTRAGTEPERAYLQGIVDSLAQKFYGVVVKARPKMTEAQRKDAFGTARIYIGEDIVRVGLADAVMSRDEAVAKVKVLSGSKNVYTREELSKFVKNASEAASMRPTFPPVHADGDDPIFKRAMAHLDTVMELVGEVRRGEAVRFSYLMPYRF